MSRALTVLSSMSRETIFVLIAVVILSANSFAATTGTTLDVSLSAVVSCTVQTTPVVFDGYDGSVDVVATGDVTVTCPEKVFSMLWPSMPGKILQVKPGR